MFRLDGVTPLYRSLPVHSVKNPWIVPFIFNSIWLGQRLKKEICLAVCHYLGEDPQPGAPVVCSDFRQLLDVNFEFGEEFSFRKAHLHMKGNLGHLKQKIFAKILIGLAAPEVVCDITFSPVQFRADGKPQLPKVRGLRTTINALIQQDPGRVWRIKELYDFVLSVCTKAKLLVDLSDASKVVDALCLVGILVDDFRAQHDQPGNGLKREVHKAEVFEAFGDQLDAVS